MSDPTLQTLEGARELVRDGWGSKNLDLSFEATPNADAALEVIAACESAGAVVARHIVAQHPQMDVDEITDLTSAELFYAAQDTAQACSAGVKLART